MRKKRYKIIILVMIILSSLIGCTRKDNVETKNLNITLEYSDLEDFNEIRKIINKFSTINSDYKINLQIVNDMEKVKDSIVKKEVDIIISMRNNFLYFNKNGLVKDLTSYFNQNKLQDSFFNIAYSYGKVGDKYFGVGLLPYSLGFVGNKNFLDTKDINNTDNNIDLLFDTLNKENKKIPVIFPKELSLELALSTLVANNIIKDTSLINIYDGDKSNYSDKDDIQKIFKSLSVLINKYKIDENQFYLSNEEILDKINNGEIPIALITSRAGKNKIYPNIEILEMENKQEYNVTPPVFINYMVYASSNSENVQGINKFLDYIMEDESYSEIVKDGYLTGNKKADTLSDGLNFKFLWTISQGSITNIPYYLNLPTKFISYLKENLREIIFNKKYNGNEWIEIINNVFG